MRILIADDHGLFAEGLQNLLQAGGYEVVGVAYDGLEALRLARELQPDLILMDVRMPNCNGLEATRLIKANLPEIQIVMLTTSAQEADLFEALKSGASGYLLKNLKPNVLFSYLEGLARGEAPLSRELSTRVLSEFVRQSNQLERDMQVLPAPESGSGAVIDSPGSDPSTGIAKGAATNQAEASQVELTARQLQILELIAEGLTYKEVGSTLHISENTVKYHMGEILKRLHLKNREQVVAYALRSGLFDW
jgi:DNA-binding NarL/FixJ family response regulator